MRKELPGLPNEDVETRRKVLIWREAVIGACMASDLR